MASFETKQDFSFKGGAELTFTLKQQFQDAKHSLGRFRLAVTDVPRPVTFGVPQNVKAIFAVAADKRKPAQKKKLVEAFKKIMVRITFIINKSCAVNTSRKVA